MKQANALITLALMALGLAIFQLSGAWMPALAGALLFGALACLRPDLALLWVPLAAPLYLIPAALGGLRADPANPVVLPTYEVALLLSFGATLARWLWDRLRGAPAALRLPAISPRLWRYAPLLLFLLAGVLGVLLAAERSRAIREFRWLIAEPLLFVALVWAQLAQSRAKPGAALPILPRDSQLPPFASWLLGACILSGALVGLLALLQFAGIDLVPLLGRKQCFAPDGGPCNNIVADAGVRRVLSVYGHPNNLGLSLGRIWPIAAALALAPLWARAARRGAAGEHISAAYTAGLAICALLCLGGIAVSFSRGAWLGALAALVVLALPFLQRLAPGRLLPTLIGLGAAVVVLAGLALSLRGDVTAGSTPIRLLLWREAAGYIQRQPLGLGLDQFGFYHDPASGRSLIDPALIGTSEQYAAHPHDLFLDIWLRLGPLGVIAFGWLLLRFFQNALRAARAATLQPLALGILAAMLAALAHGLVDNFYFVPDLALMFWLLLALSELLADTAQRNVA